MRSPPFSVTALLLGLVSQLGCSATPKATNPTSVHVCTEIVGLPYVALSFDGGKTLVQSREPREPGTQVSGLMALDTPDALLAIVHGELFASEDTGCHWRSAGHTNTHLFAEGLGGVAYGWGARGGLDALSVRGVRALAEPPWTTTYKSADEADARHAVAALVADVRNPRHLRLITRDGEIFDSNDQGGSWALRVARGTWSWPAIAPDDMDHLVDLGATPGVSRDGGLTWVPPRGLQLGGERPRWITEPIAVGGDVVWATAYEGVFRSTDAGQSFMSVGPRPERRDMDGGMDVTETLVVRRETAGSLLFLGTGNDLLRLDVGVRQWAKQPLQVIGDPSALITTATLIPGHPSMVCFGVMTEPPPLPEGYVTQSEGMNTPIAAVSYAHFLGNFRVEPPMGPYPSRR